jgi:colicin import membrane protein
VLTDTNVAWGGEIEPHRPDIAVIFNVRERRNWSTFAVQEEGTRPSLIFEITSPKTRQLDLDDKYEEYEQAGVSFYVIIDIIRRKRSVTRELKGYRLTPNGYVPMVVNENGWLWLEPVSTWLAITGATIACYDQDGKRIENYVALSKAKKEAEARATEAEARAAALEARLRQLEAAQPHQPGEN